MRYAAIRTVVLRWRRAEDFGCDKVREAHEKGESAISFQKKMPYLALIDNEELELADEAAVAEAIRSGKIQAETWIKDVDDEADWETVEERFPELFPDAKSQRNGGMGD